MSGLELAYLPLGDRRLTTWHRREWADFDSTLRGLEEMACPLIMLAVLKSLILPWARHWAFSSRCLLRVRTWQRVEQCTVYRQVLLSRSNSSFLVWMYSLY